MQLVDVKLYTQYCVYHVPPAWTVSCDAVPLQPTGDHKNLSTASPKTSADHLHSDVQF